MSERQRKPDRARDAAVACVESPAQLMNVIEWAYTERRGLAGGRIGTGMSIMVLPPPEPAARLQLEAVAELARGCGFAVSWHEVRGGRGAALRAVRTVLSNVARVDTLIIGDPFSGLLQMIIGAARARQVVVVDDGSATLDFVDLVSEERSLIRWHRLGDQSAVSRAVAARARRLLVGESIPDRHPATVFTAMPVNSDRLPLVRNRLDWTRARFAAPRIEAGVDLVGSSLTETGVIDERAYLQVIRTLAVREGAVRYLAHRKESNAKLVKISELGLTVVRPELPLELFARIGPIAERIISFPSTVVHTLPLALSDTWVEVLVCDLDQRWFSPGRSDGRSEAFLSAVSSSARRTHGLSVVAGIG